MMGKFSSLLIANALSHNLKIGLNHSNISATVAAWKYFLQFGITSDGPTKVPLTLGNLYISHSQYYP